mgnify:CR=1 FL=1|jgi:hypothetical protein
MAGGDSKGTNSSTNLIPGEIKFSKADARTEAISLQRNPTDDNREASQSSVGGGEISDDDMSELTCETIKKKKDPPKEIMYNLGATIGASPLKEKLVFDWEEYKKEGVESFSA